MEIRIAHIISGLGIGGAERQLVNLMNAINCSYKALITIGAPREDRTFEEALDSTIDRYSVPVRRRQLPIGLYRLARTLKRLRINVVHTHMYESNLFGSLAAKLAGIPVVVTTEHGENPWKRGFHRWLERNLISSIADMRLCVSPKILEIRRDLERIPATKLRLMVNGTVVPNEIRAPRETGTLIVGAVGRFIPAKDYGSLIRAISALKKSGHELRLCLLGDGPCRAELSELQDELALCEDVEMPGMVSNVDEWYRKFDIFVSSSVREGLPMVLLEAMARGIPVVATDVGACADVVHHETGGLIVPPSNPSELAAAIERLATDPDLRKRLGENARAIVVDRYSVTKIAANHVALYRELLEAEAANR